MKILTDKRDAITSESVCAIGSFDGVHRGHQAIIHQAKELAGSTRRLGVITFFPLPFFVLKSVQPIYLTLKKEKEALLRALGVDFMYYFSFTEYFAHLTPREFVEIVDDTIAPSSVVVGENFHFGKKREGSAHMLRQLANGKFSVHIVPRIDDDGTISSTRIRELLLLGHVPAANKLLGREYALSGIVVKGKGKGTQLGFPTINIKVSPEKLLPLDGVYKAKVAVHDNEYTGALFCRHNLIEVHLLQFTGKLYRRAVVVKLLKRIRGIERFRDDKALRAAIAHDVALIGGDR